MSNLKIREGDVVRLKSGGPTMTVTGIVPNHAVERVGGKYTVAWFNVNDDLQRSFFNSEQLDHVLS